MKFTSSILVVAIFLSSSFVAQISNAETDDLKLNYPELMVTPSASKRLELESVAEKKSGNTKYLPYEVSALMTLVTAGYLGSIDQTGMNQSDKDVVKYGSMAGVVVGGAWMGLALWMNSNYRPYESGLHTVGSMPRGTQSEILARERLAEESLYQAGDLATKLKWLSFSSNFAVSAYMMSANNNNLHVIGALSLIASAAPLLFPLSYEHAANVHREYKKKIYGPVVSMGFVPTRDGIMPVTLWSLNF